MPDYAQLLDAARDAVADACTVCRVVQSGMDRVRAILKDDRSPVTIADFGAQAVVGRTLRQRLGPGTVMVGEETSAYLRNPEHGPQLDATLAAVREVWDDATPDALLDAIDIGASDTHHAGFWTLDPIDGTKGFLRGEQYAVCLAYIERGEVMVAALGCPNLPARFDAGFDVRDPHGTLYLAIRGQGAWELPADNPRAHPTRALRPERSPGTPISLCTSVEESHSNFDRVSQVMARVGPTREPARLDSQAKYAVVARGQADAYLRIPTRAGYHEWIWDHAAGALIAAEAGCAATDIDGKPLDFGRGRRLEGNRGILLAPPAIHGRLLGAIRELGF